MPRFLASLRAVLRDLQHQSDDRGRQRRTAGRPWNPESLESRLVLSGQAVMTDGPVPVKGINPATGDSVPIDAVNINGTLYFSADDGQNGRELWSVNSDGVARIINSVSGSLSSSDGIGPGAFGSFPISLYNHQGVLYFRADDGFNGVELWRLNDDGLAEMVSPPVVMEGIGPGAAGSYPQNLTSVGGTLYFLANDGSGYGL